MFDLARVLDHHVARDPGREVLVHGDRRIGAAELAARVDAVAAGLAALGVRTGEVVALLTYNHVEFLETVLAAGRLGAVVLPLNYRLAPDEWRYILDNAGTVVLVTEDEFRGRIDELAPALPTIRHRVLLGAEAPEGWIAYETLVADGAGATPVPPGIVDDEHTLARLMYTSGTTSRPKGVRITHGNVAWKNLGLIVELGLSADDTVLVCGPLYHCGGLDLPGLAAFHMGARLVLMRSFDAAGVLDAIEREKVGIVWLAPAMMNAVLQVPDLADRDTTSVRCIIGGGEKMPEPVVRRILEAFPNTWFADAYGLTETVSGDTVLDREHSLSKIGSVGRPIPHVEVRIVDEQGADVPAGELGEIALRGPKVFDGYWRDEEATARAIRDGWFHTGDIGRLDADGFLYVEDRLKDMIISGGENIATPEVERVLYEHPAVLEAAVVAMPHERWGEVPRAVVVLKPGERADAEDIRAFCRDRLAKFKVPVAVDFLDALPRTPSGKVLKRELR
ncbi:acyl-CoA synthetase [Pseudonocardia dioxanivorans]|uniref:acyl-CoA synthetase n=1 Tax=Pseudonocardia dioxanivorans TaxID=240495 RepID=UPI000CD1DDA2|nr:long-chain fatty acid--CoA ligase [Pseudonocardia dioxanivorans]